MKQRSVIGFPADSVVGGRERDREPRERERGRKRVQDVNKSVIANPERAGCSPGFDRGARNPCRRTTAVATATKRAGEAREANHNGNESASEIEGASEIENENENERESESESAIEGSTVPKT